MLGPAVRHRTLRNAHASRIVVANFSLGRKPQDVKPLFSALVGVLRNLGMSKTAEDVSVSWRLLRDCDGRIGCTYETTVGNTTCRATTLPGRASSWKRLVP